MNSCWKCRWMRCLTRERLNISASNCLSSSSALHLSRLPIAQGSTVPATTHTHTHTHTHPFNGPLSGTTRVGRYQKGKTNLDFTEARDSEWQWHQLGHMQVCISLQTDNYTSTPPLSFLQAGCPSCRPTNSVKALNAECTQGRLCLLLIWHFRLALFVT